MCLNGPDILRRLVLGFECWRESGFPLGHFKPVAERFYWLPVSRFARSSRSLLLLSSHWQCYGPIISFLLLSAEPHIGENHPTRCSSPPPFPALSLAPGYPLTGGSRDMGMPRVWDYSILMLLIPFPSAQPGSLPPNAPTGARGETSLSQMARESNAKLPCQTVGTFTGWA